MGNIATIRAGDDVKIEVSVTVDEGPAMVFITNTLDLFSDGQVILFSDEIDSLISGLKQAERLIKDQAIEKPSRPSDPKSRIREILYGIINNEDRYWYRGSSIRWGVVEQDLYAIVDRLEVSDDRPTVDDI